MTRRFCCVHHIPSLDTADFGVQVAEHLQDRAIWLCRCWLHKKEWLPTLSTYSKKRSPPSSLGLPRSVTAQDTRFSLVQAYRLKLRTAEGIVDITLICFCGPRLWALGFRVKVVVFLQVRSQMQGNQATSGFAVKKRTMTGDTGRGKGSGQLVAALPYIRTDIPIAILFRALG